MKNITINTKLSKFTIHFKNDFNFVRAFLKIPYHIVVIDAAVYKFYKKKIFSMFPRDSLMIIKCTEKIKERNKATTAK